MKRRIIVSLFHCFTASLLIIQLLANFVFAQSEEASPGAVSEEKVKEKIKERLEETNQQPEVLGKSEGEIYAFVGPLKSLSNHTLLIETLNGEKQVSLDEETNLYSYLEDQGQKSIEEEEIELEKFTIAMGRLDNHQVLQAQRVIFSKEPEPAPSRKVMQGKIEAIGKKNTFTLATGEKLIDLTVEKETKIEVIGKKEGKFEDLSVDDEAVVVLQENKKGEFLKAIFVIPQKPIQESEEPSESTPSAEE